MAEALVSFEGSTPVHDEVKRTISSARKFVKEYSTVFNEIKELEKVIIKHPARVGKRFILKRPTPEPRGYLTQDDAVRIFHTYRNTRRKILSFGQTTLINVALLWINAALDTAAVHVNPDRIYDPYILRRQLLMQETKVIIPSPGGGSFMLKRQPMHRFFRITFKRDEEIERFPFEITFGVIKEVKTEYYEEILRTRVTTSETLEGSKIHTLNVEGIRKKVDCGRDNRGLIAMDLIEYFDGSLIWSKPVLLNERPPRGSFRVRNLGFIPVGVFDGISTKSQSARDLQEFLGDELRVHFDQLRAILGLYPAGHESPEFIILTRGHYFDLVTPWGVQRIPAPTRAVRIKEVGRLLFKDSQKLL